MKDAELYVAGGMSSSSPAMFERRRRILSAARRLIELGHADGFSMRQLSDRAGVAMNTLYNAFGSKENIAALAMTQYFEDFHRAITFENAPDSLAGVIEREITITVRNLVIPQYVRAVTTLFFSATAGPHVRAALVAIGASTYMPWLEQVRSMRKLEACVDFGRIPANLSALLYAQVQEWRVSEIDDAEFLNCRIDGVLSYLGGITKGAVRQELRNYFADLHGARVLIGPLIARATMILSGEATASAARLSG